MTDNARPYVATPQSPPPELWMPPLTMLETVVLLALLRLGLDAYRDGAAGKTAAVLDGIPQATFDNLARKLNRGL